MKVTGMSLIYHLRNDIEGCPTALTLMVTLVDGRDAEMTRIIDAGMSFENIFVTMGMALDREGYTVL